MCRVEHRPGTWIDPATGAVVAHTDLLRSLSTAQAVLLGETHDRYDIHRWQLHVLTGLHALNTNIAVGFEMFPVRVQPVLDAWVAGALERDEFLEKVEWKTVWGFPGDLYMPIFQFCRQFRVPMRALNCRRALVTEVGKLGWDAIPEEDRDGVTPAVPASPEHRQYLFDLTGGGRPDRKAASAMDPEFDRFVRAQQTWDRAFACNIVRAREVHADALVVGIIGRGHMEYGHGTPFQLAHLGLDNVAVLLPSDEETLAVSAAPASGRAVFRLDTGNDPASRAVRELKPGTAGAAA